MLEGSAHWLESYAYYGPLRHGQSQRDAVLQSTKGHGTQFPGQLPGALLPSLGGALLAAPSVCIQQDQRGSGGAARKVPKHAEAREQLQQALMEYPHLGC